MTDNQDDQGNGVEVDLSAEAIKRRLQMVAELFRLTSALGRARLIGPVEEGMTSDSCDEALRDE